MTTTRDTRRRLRRAAVALAPYADRDDHRAPVVDLVTDLRHHCARLGIPFRDVLRVSAGHFRGEHAAAAGPALDPDAHLRCRWCGGLGCDDCAWEPQGGPAD